MIKVKANINPASRNTLVELYNKIQELPEKEYEVFVSDMKPTRSLQANSYYWMILTALSDHTGELKEDLHEFCKYKFNKGVVVDPESQDVIEIVLSTTRLNVEDFQNYVDAVLYWARELGCIIPDIDNIPDEVAVIHGIVK